jgi:hypothetical protein
VLDQPGGPASAAIADAGTGRGGRIADAGCACRIVTGASARTDTASHRLALSDPGQIEVFGKPAPFRSGSDGVAAR